MQNKIIKKKKYSDVFDLILKGTRTQLDNYLCNNIKEINIQNKDGDTPLHIALRNKYKDQAIILLTCGADFNIKNKTEETAFDIAASLDMKDILEVMHRMNYLKSNSLPPKLESKVYDPKIKKNIIQNVEIQVTKGEIVDLIKNILFDNDAGKRVLMNSFLTIHSAFFTAMQNKDANTGSDITKIIMDESKNSDRFENLFVFNLFIKAFDDLLDTKAQNIIKLKKNSKSFTKKK
jgi:ankyrin repeat protein